MIPGPAHAGRHFYSGEGGVPRFERCRTADQRAGDPRGVRTTDANDAQTPASRGVAIATIVSEVENMSGSRIPESQPGYLTEMMTVFSNASPMLSVVTFSTSATARWTMRRS